MSAHDISPDGIVKSQWDPSKDVLKDQTPEDYTTLSQALFFPTPLQWVELPDVLANTLEASNFYLEATKNSDGFEMNKAYPVVMAGINLEDDRFHELSQYVVRTCWNILQDQGYDMERITTTIQNVWAQEHHTYSGHDPHVHSFGSQMCAFYFLEVPDDSCKFIIGDPRPGKIQIDLPKKQEGVLTVSNSDVYFNVKPGMLYFANSWVPHGFTRNTSDKPFKFIHFTIGTEFNQGPKNVEDKIRSVEIV